MPWPDADHAAPGALADELADAHQLEAVAEDVAVGPRLFIGQRDHGTRRGLVGIAGRLAPAQQVPGDALAGDLLQQQLRDMAAAVVADIDDEPVAIALGGEVAVKLGEARAHHVGQMEVAHAAATGFVDPGAVALDPFAVARRVLVGKRRDHHFALGALGVGQHQRNLGAGPVDEHRLRRPFGRERLTADRDDALARLRLHTHRVQG